MSLNNATNNILEAIKLSVLDGYDVTKFCVQKNTLVLTEDSPEAKCKEVKFDIENPNDILVLKFDKKVVYEEANENQEAKKITKPTFIFEGNSAFESFV